MKPFEVFLLFVLMALSYASGYVSRGESSVAVVINQIDSVQKQLDSVKENAKSNWAAFQRKSEDLTRNFLVCQVLLVERWAAEEATPHGVKHAIAPSMGAVTLTLHDRVEAVALSITNARTSLQALRFTLDSMLAGSASKHDVWDVLSKDDE